MHSIQAVSIPPPPARAATGTDPPRGGARPVAAVVAARGAPKRAIRPDPTATQG